MSQCIYARMACKSLQQPVVGASGRMLGGQRFSLCLLGSHPGISLIVPPVTAVCCLRSLEDCIIIALGLKQRTHN